MRLRKKRIDKLLGEILVERGLLTQDQVSQILETQKKEGGLFGEITVKTGLATEEDIAQCIAYQFGFPYLPLEPYEFSPGLEKILPRELAEKYCLVPLDNILDSLTIAMANPLDLEASEKVAQATGLNIMIFVSTASDVRNALKKVYKVNG